MKKAPLPQVSLLLEAVCCGDLSRVRELVTAGADVNARGLNGWTPLIHAALASRADVVEFLLQAGAEVDAQAHDGSTALIKATLWNHSAVVATLLRYGAQPAIQDADGWTAWQIAVEKGNFEIIELLRAADV